MCKTKLDSLNLSFPLFSYVISTTITKFLYEGGNLVIVLDFLHFHFDAKTITIVCYYCTIIGTESLFTSSLTSSVKSPKKLP